MRPRCYLLALLAAMLAVQAVASAAPRPLTETPTVPRPDAVISSPVALPDQVRSAPRRGAEPEMPDLSEEISDPEPSGASEPAEAPTEPLAEAQEEPAIVEGSPVRIAEPGVPAPTDDEPTAGDAETIDDASAENERETSSAAPGAPQPLEASPMLDGTLAITVATDVRFGTVQVGASTAAVPFGMTIQNLSDQGWQVTVEGSDLVGAEVATPPIARTSLYLAGGTGPFPVGVITSYAGYLSATGPMVLLQGSGEAWGEFTLTVDSTILFEVPADAVPDTYRATLTYTIMAWEP